MSVVILEVSTIFVFPIQDPQSSHGAQVHRVAGHQEEEVHAAQQPLQVREILRRRPEPALVNNLPCLYRVQTLYIFIVL